MLLTTKKDDLKKSPLVQKKLAPYKNVSINSKQEQTAARNEFSKNFPPWIKKISKSSNHDSRSGSLSALKELKRGRKGSHLSADRLHDFERLYDESMRPSTLGGP